VKSASDRYPKNRKMEIFEKNRVKPRVIEMVQDSDSGDNREVYLDKKKLNGLTSKRVRR